MYCVFCIIFHCREKLGHNAAFLQIPIGLESKCSGLVDVISHKAIFFEGEYGEEIVEKPVPENLVAIAKQKKKELIGNFIIPVCNSCFKLKLAYSDIIYS